MSDKKTVTLEFYRDPNFDYEKRCLINPVNGLIKGTPTATAYDAFYNTEKKNIPALVKGAKEYAEVLAKLAKQHGVKF